MNVSITYLDGICPSLPTIAFNAPQRTSLNKQNNLRMLYYTCLSFLSSQIKRFLKDMRRGGMAPGRKIISLYTYMCVRERFSVENQGIV
jgi:hypothetical protein